MDGNTSLNRVQLRKLLRSKRRSLSSSEQTQAAQQLYQQLAQHPLFRRAQHIAFYIASDGEIDPLLLMREAWRRGKHVYLPVLARWPKPQWYFSACVRVIRNGRRIVLVFCSRVGVQQISAQYGLWMRFSCRWWALISMADG